MLLNKIVSKIGLFFSKIFKNIGLKQPKKTPAASLVDVYWCLLLNMTFDSKHQ